MKEDREDEPCLKFLYFQDASRKPPDLNEIRLEALGLDSGVKFLDWRLRGYSNFAF